MSAKRAFVVTHRDVCKKIWGKCIADVSQEVPKKFPALKSKKFRIQYYDTDVTSYVDADDDDEEDLPSGTKIQLLEVYAPETETLFPEGQTYSMMDGSEVSEPVELNASTSTQPPDGPPSIEESPQTDGRSLRSVLQNDSSGIN